VIIIIIAYGFFLRKTKIKDPLTYKIYSHPICQDIDGWSISHVIFFLILGILFPGNYLQFFAVGVLWEIIETILGQHETKLSGTRLQLIGDQDESGVSTGKDNAYWYGKESDILADVLGYTIGSYISEKYWPNSKKTYEDVYTIQHKPIRQYIHGYKKQKT
jgi:hypothetical protein